MNNDYVSAQLAQWLTRARGRSFDVVIAGRIIGGKSGEASQEPEQYTLSEDGFTIYFGDGYTYTITDPDGTNPVTVTAGGTEILTVLRPSAVSMGPAGELMVPTADEARFGWHYYGRPQTEENWCMMIYRRRDTQVEVTVTGPSRDHLPADYPEVFPYPGDPFVLLTPL